MHVEASHCVLCLLRDIRRELLSLFRGSSLLVLPSWFPSMMMMTMMIIIVIILLSFVLSRSIDRSIDWLISLFACLYTKSSCVCRSSSAVALFIIITPYSSTLSWWFTHSIFAFFTSVQRECTYYNIYIYIYILRCSQTRSRFISGSRRPDRHRRHRFGFPQAVCLFAICEFGLSLPLSRSSIDPLRSFQSFISFHFISFHSRLQYEIPEEYRRDWYIIASIVSLWTFISQSP